MKYRLHQIFQVWLAKSVCLVDGIKRCWISRNKPMTCFPEFSPSLNAFIKYCKHFQYSEHHCTQISCFILQSLHLFSFSNSFKLWNGRRLDRTAIVMSQYIIKNFIITVSFNLSWAFPVCKLKFIIYNETWIILGLGPTALFVDIVRTSCRTKLLSQAIMRYELDQWMM